MKHLTHKNFENNCITIDDTIFVPFGTTNINSGALRSTRATTVVLPNTITKIGGNALPKTVTDIYYLGNEEQWEGINKSPIWSGVGNPRIVISQNISPLWDCIKKLDKEFGGSLLDGVTNIDDYVFHYYTNTGSVAIPGSVTKLTVKP